MFESFTEYLDPDLAMTLGLLIGAFSVPAILSAMSDGRAPRAPMFTILIAFGLITFAAYNKPGGYEISELPDILIGTIAKFFP
jgi:hypothetical protein